MLAWRPVPGGHLGQAPGPHPRNPELEAEDNGLIVKPFLDGLRSSFLSRTNL